MAFVNAIVLTVESVYTFGQHIEVSLCLQRVLFLAAKI